jgi:outer membrane lipoprotein-sorting protein
MTDISISGSRRRSFRLGSLRTLPAAALFLASLSPALAPAQDLNSVLAKLDAAAAKFKSAQAEISTDIVQTQPLPDEDKQTGTVLFERKGAELQMALHLKTDNGKPVVKDLVYTGGVGKLYDPQLKQMQVFKAGANQAQAETILTLGFGGSGKDLQKSWQIAYSGTEQVDGKPTAKLDLVPRDPSVRKTYPKVTLWVDLSNGLALKQQFFDASGSSYKLATYRNIRLNAKVPSNAFQLKVASDTQIINH